MFRVELADPPGASVTVVGVRVEITTGLDDTVRDTPALKPWLAMLI